MFYFIFISILIVLPSAYGTVWYVEPGMHLPTVVDAAAEGDSVILLDGYHAATVHVRLKGLAIGSLYLIDGDTTHITSTIVEPDFLRPDTNSSFVYSDCAYRVNLLKGFTCRNGAGTRFQNQISGGAIFAYRSALTLEALRFEDCWAQNGGAARFDGGNLEPTVRIQDCEFQNCTAESYGGSVQARKCSLFVENSNFAANQAGVAGGGAFIDDSYVGLRRIIVQNCGAGMDAGGFLLYDVTGWMRESVFDSNRSHPDGFAHLIVGDSRMDIMHSVFSRNATPSLSMVLESFGRNIRFLGNIVEENVSSDRITGTILIPNNTRGEIGYCIFRNNVNLRGGTLNPITGTRMRIHHNVFETNRSLNSADGSVLLCLGAPVTLDSNIFENNGGTTISFPTPADAVRLHAEHNWWGDASGPFHPVLNPAGRGDTLLSDSVLFIPWLTEPPDTTMPSAIERPRPEFAATWRLAAVYPNPFNSEVRLIIAGFTRDDFRLTLHNLLGQEVDVLHTGALTGGELLYRAPSRLASGVYFVNASGGGFTDTRKVVLIR